MILTEFPIYLNLLNVVKAIVKEKKKDNELMLKEKVLYTHASYDAHKQY